MARPRLVTTEQILATTRRTVVERGAMVSLDEVAERLGITGPALLKRFGSRKDLMLGALMPPDRPAFFDALEHEPDDRPFNEQLRELFTRMLSFFEENMPCMMALRELGYDREMMQRWKTQAPVRALQMLSQWLAAAANAGLIELTDAETVATAMLGAVSHRAFTSHLLKRRTRAGDHAQYAADLAELFTRALATGERPYRRTPPRRGTV